MWSMLIGHLPCVHVLSTPTHPHSSVAVVLLCPLHGMSSRTCHASIPYQIRRSRAERTGNVSTPRQPNKSRHYLIPWCGTSPPGLYTPPVIHPRLHSVYSHTSTHTMWHMHAMTTVTYFLSVVNRFTHTHTHTHTHNFLHIDTVSFSLSLTLNPI